MDSAQGSDDSMLSRCCCICIDCVVVANWFYVSSQLSHVRMASDAMGLTLRQIPR